MWWWEGRGLEILEDGKCSGFEFRRTLVVKSCCKDTAILRSLAHLGLCSPAIFLFFDLLGSARKATVEAAGVSSELSLTVDATGLEAVRPPLIYPPCFSSYMIAFIDSLASEATEVKICLGT